MTRLEIVIASAAWQSGRWYGAKVAIQLLLIPAKRVPAKAGSRNPVSRYHSDGSRNPEGEEARGQQVFELELSALNLFSI